MTYEVEKIDNSQDTVHYKFTSYKTVNDKNGNEVEVVDRERRYTLGDLQNQLSKAQDKVSELQGMIAEINNLE